MVENGWPRFLRWLGFTTSVKSLNPDGRRPQRVRSRRDTLGRANWPAVASPLLALIAAVALFVPTAQWPAPSLLLLLLAATLGVVGRRRAKTGAPYKRFATAGLTVALLTVAFVVLGLLVLFNAFTHTAF